MNKLFLILEEQPRARERFSQPSIRVYTLDDARFDRFEDRLSYAKYWRNEHDRLKEIIKGSLSEVSDFDYRRFRLIDQFPVTNIGDILALFSDTVRPRSFEDFLKYGFEDGELRRTRRSSSPCIRPAARRSRNGRNKRGRQRPKVQWKLPKRGGLRREANRRKTVWRIVGALSIVAVAIALAVAVSPLHTQAVGLVFRYVYGQEALVHFFH